MIIIYCIIYIALVAPTGGKIGTIHVQVQLVISLRRHRSQSLSVLVKGLDTHYAFTMAPGSFKCLRVIVPVHQTSILV